MRFRVWRSGAGGKDGRYEVYDIEPRPGMNVLEVLFEIQDVHDDSLAFRYSCRGAVCGSCAMTINREPRLACRTQLSNIGKYKPMGLALFGPLLTKTDWDPEREVLVEPLPVLPILKDLVVDMDRFYEHYRKVRPWQEPTGSSEVPRMLPRDTEKIERWGNCILCAACFGSCPVCAKNPDYLGPAALAWALRFIDDVRVKDPGERLGLVGAPEGAPACEWYYNCVKVCPKNVAPALAIRALRTKLGEPKSVRQEGI